MYLFSPFISDQSALSEDAVSYSNHVRFYVENLKEGIFPLWNIRASCGVANDFFLRRICPYNPVWFFMIIFQGMGMSFNFSYSLLLILYFFLGVVGFYKIAKLIIRDSSASFLAFLLLLFSSLGTRQLDSYLNLVFIPMMWFFYFLIAFTREKEKRHFWGMVFTLSILLTTYIPFYFAIIFLFFIVCWLIFYFRESLEIIRGYWSFIKENRRDIVVSCLIIIVSIVPTLVFYSGSARKDFVFPMRHGIAEHVNALAVYVPNIVRWGIVEDVVFSTHYANTKFFHGAVFYVPIFLYVVFFLGMIVRIKKRVALLSILGTLIFLMAAPTITPIYNFLYNYIFFIKFFRNLHFFLWIAVLPILVFLASELFKEFVHIRPGSKRQKMCLAVFILIVHVGFGLYFYFLQNITVSTFCVIAFSWMFFTFYFLSVSPIRKWLFLASIFVLVTIQPVEQYQHFTRNYSGSSGFYIKTVWERVHDSSRFEFIRNPVVVTDSFPHKSVPLYYGTYWFNFIRQELDDSVLRKYAMSRFIVYDNTKSVDSNKIDKTILERTLSSMKNVAFISDSGRDDNLEKASKSNFGENLGAKAEKLTENSSRFRVLRFNTNDVKVKTNFKKKKFLVYNDAFSPDWNVFINGKKAELFRANVAFKGVWVPPGENIVHFKFGARWYYFLNFFVLIMFYGFFAYIIWLNVHKYLILRKNVE